MKKLEFSILDIFGICGLCFTAGCVVMGLTGEYQRQNPVIVHKEEVIQKDGSRILELNPEKPMPSPPDLPKNSKMTRMSTVEFRIKENKSENVDELRSKPYPDHLELHATQIETQDGHSRMVIDSDDVEIIGGADWEIRQTVRNPKIYHWQGLLMKRWSPSGTDLGIKMGYTVGPIVSEVGAFPDQIQIGIGARW